MSVRPDLRPKGMGRLLDNAFELYRANFKTITLGSAIVIFPFALMMGVAQSFYLRGFLGFFSGMGNFGSPEEFLGLQAWQMLSYAVSPAYGIARLYISVCIFAAAPRMIAGERVSLREYLRPGLKRTLWMVLTVWIVQMVVGMGFVFFIVPGVILFVGLAVARVVVVVEDASLGQAFGRSWKLSRGHFWRIIGFWMAVATLMFVLQAVVNSPSAIRQLSASIQDPDAIFQPVSVGWKTLEGLFAALSTSLVYPFVELSWFFLYLDLRARREGMDLVARAQAIVQGPR